MKRISLLFIISFLLMSSVKAQMPWAKKAAGAVFTLKTFTANGSLLASSNGFFITPEGDAISCFAPFKGAHRAVVIDAQGKEWPVTTIIGANETYDVAKFTVAIKKAPVLTVASNAITVEGNAWLLPYSVKKVPTCKHATISHAEPFMEKYTYYTMTMKSDDLLIGCPLMNDKGEVVGIMQPAADTKGTSSYAVDVRLATDLQMNGLGMNDPTMRMTAIAKALPDNYEQAQLALYVSTSVMDSTQYRDYLERFIQKFPNASDGYIYRARHQAAGGHYDDADKDMLQAIKVADKKDEAYYQYAQLMYQKEITPGLQPYKPWSLDHALDIAKQAYATNAQPVYQQQQAQILFAQKQYDQAYNIYWTLAKDGSHPAENYYAAAQCKLQQQDRDAALVLMDSAVNTFAQPYMKDAAPYLLARGQMLANAEKYRQAVNDYNSYETLMRNQLAHGFYYMREQAELKGHLFKQALDDIGRAISMAPEETMYYAEKASLEVRVGLHEEAILTAQKLISLAPDDSDGYLFLGLSQCLKGQKDEGRKNLERAKTLGHEQAQSFIEKYGK